MAVAKIEQRKVRLTTAGVRTSGRSALLASPIYIGQTRGREKTYKRRSQRVCGGVVFLLCMHTLFLFSWRLLGPHALTSRGCIFLYFLNKTAL